MKMLLRFITDLRLKIVSHHLSLLIFFCVVLSAILFISCASAPGKESIRKSPDYNNSIGKVIKIGIISDAAIVSNSIFSKDICISIEDSIIVESYMLKSAQKDLAAKGYEVIFQYSPFVGGVYDSDKSYKVLHLKEKNITEKPSPFYIEDSLNADTKYMNALRMFMMTGFKNIKAIGVGSSSPSDHYLTGKDMKENLKIIAEKTKADALLVLVGSGVVISSGEMAAKYVGQFMLAFTTALAGVSVGIPINKPYLNTWAALVSLDNGEIIWTNRKLFTTSPLEKGLYEGYYNNYSMPAEWPNGLFYHFNNRKKINNL